MKTGIGDQGASAGQNRRSLEEGYALMLTMFMVAVSLTLLIATMSRLTGDADLNARNGQYNASLYAAEAAVERVVARMRYDYVVGGGSAAVSNNVDNGLYRSYYPGKLGATEDPSGYWSNFQFSDGVPGNINATYVSAISGLTWGPLQSQFAGLNGWTQIYRVLSNAKQINGRFDLTNAVLEDVQLVQIPIFQFGIFYNGLMEFTWCATFTVNGRTHANGDIYVGAASTLTFNSTVTTTGGIYKTNWDGHTLAQMTAPVNYNGNPGYSTNVGTLWLPIGTDNTPPAVREVVNLPPVGEDPTSPLGSQRYYNKASIALLVSNMTVTAYAKTSGTDAPISLTVTSWGTNSPSLLANFPFLSVTNFFTDQRELSKTVRVTQIDVGAYGTWLTTSSFVLNKFPVGSPATTLYVMDNRTSATNTDLFAVRLTNGAIIPINGPVTQPGGWTVATPNPLYVWGHYTIGPAGSITAGDTDTSKTYPASLVSDALTILSGNWQDTNSAGATSSRIAANTTVNAAILTGIVYSTDGTSNHFSGGVMNLPRLLEAWSDISGGNAKTLTLNTSIVNLFDSVRATNWFRNPGPYYYAPVRKFSFDNNFTNQVKLPPATPVLGFISRAKWRVPPPNNVTYVGN
jgi:hypothetical protein